MIRIDVEKYCSDCLDFDPDVIKPVRNTLYFEYLDSDTPNFLVSQTDTVVRCKHAKRCEALKRHLEQKLKEGKNEELV